jgi:hypothetical protein
MITIGQKLLAPYYTFFGNAFVGQCIHKCFCVKCVKRFTQVGFQYVEIASLKLIWGEKEIAYVKIPKIITKRLGERTHGESHSQQKTLKMTSSDYLQFDVCLMEVDFLKGLQTL